MSELPARLPTTTVGQPVPAKAQELINAVEDALAVTSYRNNAPLPATGNSPPVAQPGRPPMSQKATDASALMLSGSVLTVAAGGATTAVLWMSGHANPVVIGLVFGAPTALILAFARLARRVGQAAPDVHNHTYEGTVHQDQRNVRTKTSGVWAKTNNKEK